MATMLQGSAAAVLTEAELAQLRTLPDTRTDLSPLVAKLLHILEVNKELLAANKLYLKQQSSQRRSGSGTPTVGTPRPGIPGTVTQDQSVQTEQFLDQGSRASMDLGRNSGTPVTTSPMPEGGALSSAMKEGQGDSHGLHIEVVREKTKRRGGGGANASSSRDSSIKLSGAGSNDNPAKSTERPPGQDTAPFSVRDVSLVTVTVLLTACVLRWTR